MNKILLISLLFLVGCGSTPEVRVELVPVPIPVVCEDLDKIPPVIAEPVIYEKAINEQGEIVAGLNGDNFSNQAINSKDTLRYIKEQTGAISYYKKCISDHNTTIEKEGELQ